MALVEYEVSGRAAYITLNRPEKRNALSPVLVSDLKKMFQRADEDEQAKIVVLRARGEAFCAGADLSYLQQLQKFSFDENLSDSIHLKELFLLMYRMKKVTIAQVQGHALAGGCGLACVCDFVFASSSAKFGYTEVKIGFIPAIVSAFLIRRIGEGRARELLLTGKLITATEAQVLGICTEVTEPDQLEEKVRTFADSLSTTASAQVLAMTRGLIGRVQDLPLDEALNLAARTNAEARATDDCKRGIASFLEKKDITW